MFFLQSGAQGSGTNGDISGDPDSQVSLLHSPAKRGMTENSSVTTRANHMEATIMIENTIASIM